MRQLCFYSVKICFPNFNVLMISSLIDAIKSDAFSVASFKVIGALIIENEALIP